MDGTGLRPASRQHLFQGRRRRAILLIYQWVENYPYKNRDEINHKLIPVNRIGANLQAAIATAQEEMETGGGGCRRDPGTITVGQTNRIRLPVRRPTP